MEKLVKVKKPTEEELIHNTFNALRTEQRQLATKLSEIELDLNEHSIVIDTLNKLDEERKCFRLIGGVLVERKICDVLPTLIKNRGEMGKIVKTLNEQLTKKGIEINDFKNKHNIQVRGGITPISEEVESQSVEKKTDHGGSVIVNNV
ncbi:prefoldin subunit 2 [Rhopalosiphum maidis]|uniref:prefoldin subunit 2 n=1 Tax=Rhopalosiphum maidis TaxID=43146 RepID=UPI000EFEEEBE|nr:prefoldin subunit 2 [Rhopalosiphum maidis]XP_060852501.1 prefoldin subunit 2 [Rhopalosiphum padi]